MPLRRKRRRFGDCRCALVGMTQQLFNWLEMAASTSSPTCAPSPPTSCSPRGPTFSTPSPAPFPNYAPHRQTFRRKNERPIGRTEELGVADAVRGSAFDPTANADAAGRGRRGMRPVCRGSPQQSPPARRPNALAARHRSRAQQHQSCAGKQLTRLSQLAMRIGNFRGDGREFASQYKGRRSEIVCSIDQVLFHESEFVHDSPACI